MGRFCLYRGHPSELAETGEKQDSRFRLKLFLLPVMPCSRRESHPFLEIQLPCRHYEQSPRESRTGQHSALIFTTRGEHIQTCLYGMCDVWMHVNDFIRALFDSKGQG